MKRLEAIISFVSKDDYVADIGCDHAKVAIDLSKNKLCKGVIATDINKNALENAKANILKNNLKIKTYLSDGLKDVNDNKLDTLIIAGMGTSTVLHIMDTVNTKKIKKVIVSSNNDLYLLRKEMSKKGFYLEDEKVIFERKHYYVIELFTLNKRKLGIKEKYFGLYNKNNLDYYKYLSKSFTKIDNSLTFKNLIKKMSIKYKLFLLNSFIRRK